MSSDNGFLSQEEIDALLNGGSDSTPSDEVGDDTLEESNVQEDISSVEEEEGISDLERDLLGEIGNISMGSASTALSTIINQQVNITTPQVEITTLNELRDSFEVPNIALEVQYTSGILGENLLVMKIDDAAVIANLMMGGDGKIEKATSLSEIEESAVSEAMNQMIGSAATSMATMFAREVNISPPLSKIWEDTTAPLAEGITGDEPIVQVSFRLNIGELVDSKIMQILPIKTAKKIVSIMMGREDNQDNQNMKEELKEDMQNIEVQPKPVQHHEEKQYIQETKPQPKPQPQVNVQTANFKPLGEAAVSHTPQNIDLILDVPLEISVVLGRTKKSIKEVLSLGAGSLIELDKLAEEPVEILVNGKKVAYGEVVVVDENFGVRIVSIVSGEERVRSLKG
ncbi:flagellar motor switch phosphatase FliY [Clostridium sp. MB40-C1]|uniref:flagellar motor switch phosphatase FliY n=1 Tax=Clostridium sp. MB40-C1 TaxID=3070996 RepID=UPI0027DF99BF|nr:flagellar motor switch phosphatase FliY [Clostridium sp. MB40-C1]WMJ81298.1 flagellar motor switch phosphatase FliY [Clostridium sp. MB40-C1]